MLKTNIEWLKKNMGPDLKIWTQMIKEIDWSEVKRKTKLSLERDKDRIVGEFKSFMAMSPAEKMDIIMNGDIHLGWLYKKDAIAFSRREWKGLKSVGIDFVGWLKTWGGMTAMIMKDPISIALALFEYHWFASYLGTPVAIDRSNLGRRGQLLKSDIQMWGAITHWAEWQIQTQLRADARLGGDKELSKRIVLFDEMTMAQMMAGFPNLISMPYQMIPVFMSSELDQLALIPFIDAVEQYGLPGDACPLPVAECGCAIMDEYPICGMGFIASSMPCDGSTMASSFQDRRFGKYLPYYPLCFPVRYDDEDTIECAAADMKECIKWVEGLSGEKWDWDNYFKTMDIMNECTRIELEKWEMNSTPYPQMVGSSYELFRKWNYEMDGGLFPEGIAVQRKLRDTMYKTYEKRLPAYRGGYARHRALIWGQPAHFYANFSNWLANSWGIYILAEMEALNYTKMLNTTDKEEAIRDLCRLYERMVMRRHTNGGHDHVLGELWRQLKSFNADIAILYQHVSCKTMAGLMGLFDDQARENNVHLIWVEHDLMDPRTISRKDMRARVSNYMVNVMHAEPVDPSLIEFDDEASW